MIYPPLPPLAREAERQELIAATGALWNATPADLPAAQDRYNLAQQALFFRPRPTTKQPEKFTRPVPAADRNPAVNLATLAALGRWDSE